MAVWKIKPKTSPKFYQLNEQQKIDAIRKMAEYLNVHNLEQVTDEEHAEEIRQGWEPDNYFDFLVINENSVEITAP